jgi:hypothetical protein
VEHAVESGVSMKKLAAISIVSLLLAVCGVAQKSTVPARDVLFASAEVDAQGQLHIRTTDGKEITPAKDPTQVAFDKPAVSPDKHSVAWLALYPNCCTSYPIPLNLVVYSGGSMSRFAGHGLPIWKWCFLPGGKIAFKQERVHADSGVHYELHDVDGGVTVSVYDHRPADEDDASKRPDWVKAVDAAP